MNTAVIKRTAFVAAASVAGIAAVLLSTPPARAAGSDEVTSVKVRFGDLDLTSANGARKLYVRLKGAAEAVCDDNGDYVDLMERRDIEHCEQGAIESAVARIDRPKLTALYDRHFPRQPLMDAVRMSSASEAAPRTRAR